MASLIKRYLATTTSSFLINRPATTRSMATIISIPPQEGQALTVEGPTRYYTFNSRTVHPFQTAGEFHYLKVDDVVMQRSRFKLVRAAMPGVEEKGCRYWVENDNVVHFEGIAEDENQKEKPREYVGRVEFSPAVISGKIMGNMKAGILFLFVPLTFLQAAVKNKK